MPPHFRRPAAGRAPPYISFPHFTQRVSSLGVALVPYEGLAAGCAAAPPHANPQSPHPTPACMQLVSSLGIALVPYTVLLVVPLLRRMSDVCEGVRHHATRCFGSLVALLPLAQGQAPPEGLDGEQMACMKQVWAACA
eukprot:364611-Chlamydomonas_euryale.AAC.2